MARLTSTCRSSSISSVAQRLTRGCDIISSCVVYAQGYATRNSCELRFTGRVTERQRNTYHRFSHLPERSRISKYLSSRLVSPRRGTEALYPLVQMDIDRCCSVGRVVFYSAIQSITCLASHTAISPCVMDGMDGSVGFSTHYSHHQWNVWS